MKCDSYCLKNILRLPLVLPLVFLGNYIWVDTTTQNNKNYLNQQLKQLISNNFRANQHPGAIRNLLLLYIVMPYFRHFGSFVPKIWEFYYKKTLKASGRCWLPTPPAWVIFFVIFFFVPKIVPKVCNSYAALVNKECCIWNERIVSWIYIIMDMICWIYVTVIMDLVSVNSALRHATPQEWCDSFIFGIDNRVSI